jgi:hypothetical protein
MGSAWNWTSKIFGYDEEPSGRFDWLLRLNV